MATGYLRYPHVHGDLITFVAGDDVWLVPAAGGRAWPLSADGGTIAEIARRLYLSEGTVRNYLSACIQKTGARNRAEAHRIASERGWL